MASDRATFGASCASSSPPGASPSGALAAPRQLARGAALGWQIHSDVYARVPKDRSRAGPPHPVPGGEPAGWHAVRDAGWGRWDARRVAPVRVATRLDPGGLNDRLEPGGPGSADGLSIIAGLPSGIRATDPGPLESLRPDGTARQPETPPRRSDLPHESRWTCLSPTLPAPRRVRLRAGTPGGTARGAGTGAAGIDPRAEAGPAILAPLQ
jgi:hypothetical protein